MQLKRSQGCIAGPMKEISRIGAADGLPLHLVNGLKEGDLEANVGDRGRREKSNTIRTHTHVCPDQASRG